MVWLSAWGYQVVKLRVLKIAQHLNLGVRGRIWDRLFWTFEMGCLVRGLGVLESHVLACLRFFVCFIHILRAYHVMLWYLTSVHVFNLSLVFAFLSPNSDVFDRGGGRTRGYLLLTLSFRVLVDLTLRLLAFRSCIILRGCLSDVFVLHQHKLPVTVVLKIDIIHIFLVLLVLIKIWVILNFEESLQSDRTLSSCLRCWLLQSECV